jgi:tetratricopeptide (TPR) repeat protein
MIDAIDLRPILALYEEGRFCTAYTQATAQWGPLERWQGTDARVLAGRLANQLGARRLGGVLHYLAWRDDRSHAEAAVFVANEKASRFGPLAVIAFLDRLPPLRNLTDRLSAEHDAIRAEALAQLRDFDRAHAVMDAALSQAPDYAWLYNFNARLLVQEDRLDEAIDNAKYALQLHPTSVSTVHYLAHLYLNRNQDDAALELLTSAIAWAESGDLLWDRATILVELGRYTEARVDAERGRDLLPLLARDAGQEQAWSQLNADCAYYCGDYAAAAEWAAQVKTFFYQQFAQRLAAPGASTKRVLINVGFVRQHYNTCAPATLATLSRFWNLPAEHMDIVESICYDGTPGHRSREWAESHGFVAREFRVTWESAKALLDRDIPFTLTTDGPYTGHLQAVIGYDAWRHSLLVRDPQSRIIHEYSALWFEEYMTATGPRGMVLLPPEQRSRLEGIELPDMLLYDAFHQIQVAIQHHRRGEAEAICDRLRATAPDHQLTLFAEATLAHYDGDVHAKLLNVERILERFPQDFRQQRVKLEILRALGRDEERQHFLDTIGDRGESVFYLRERATTLLDHGLDPEQADAIIRRILRRQPDFAQDYALLATIRWRQGNATAALLMLRYAACREDRNEARAQRYFNAMQSQKESETALAFLAERVRRLSRQSGDPALTLAEAYLTLNRAAEAFALAERALSDHAEDSDLLLRGIDVFGANGQIERAAILLEQTRDVSHRATWHKAATKLYVYCDDLERALHHGLEAVAGLPLDMSLQSLVTGLVGVQRGDAAREEHACRWHERYPNHAELHQLLIAELANSPLDRLEETRRYIQLHPHDPWGQTQLARTLLELGRYAEGLAASEAALALDDQSAEAHSLRGELRLLLGDVAGARPALERAVRLSVDYATPFQLLFSLAQTDQERKACLSLLHAELRRQITNGDGLEIFRRYANGVLAPSEILAVLHEAMAARPDLLATHGELVAYLGANDDLPAARTAAEEMVQRFPIEPAAWLRLSQVHYASGDLEGTKAAIEQALILAPHWWEPLRRMAAILHSQGDREGALEIAQRACRTESQNEAPFLTLATYQAEDGDATAACETLERLLTRLPSSDQGWQTLRHYAGQLGATDRALALARQLSLRHPGNVVLWRHLAELLGEVEPGNVDELLNARRTLRDLQPLNAQAHADYAACLCDAGALDEAIGACYPAVFGEVRPPVLRNLEAYIRGQRNETEKAIALMEGVVTEEPDHEFGYTQLIRWYGQLGQEAAVEATYARASARQIESWQIHELYAEWLIHLGDKINAVEAYAQALTLAPERSGTLGRFLLLCLETGELERGLTYAENARSQLNAPWFLALRTVYASGLDKLELAFASMEELCKLDLDDVEVLLWATDQLLNIGNPKPWRQFLTQLWRQADVTSLLGAGWVRLHLATDGVNYVLQYLNETKTDGDIWVEGAYRFMLEMNERKDEKSLQRLIKAHTDRLRSDTALWGLVAVVQVRLDKFAWVRNWMSDWRSRPDASAQMLTALAAAYWGLDDLKAAVGVSQEVIATREDSAIHWHYTMLALERLLQGDAAAGAAYLAQVDTDNLDAITQAIFTLADTVHGFMAAAAESRTAPTWREMEATLDAQAKQWSQEMKEDMITHRISDRLRKRLKALAKRR